MAIANYIHVRIPHARRTSTLCKYSIHIWTMNIEQKFQRTYCKCIRVLRRRSSVVCVRARSAVYTATHLHTCIVRMLPCCELAVRAVKLILVKNVQCSCIGEHLQSRLWHIRRPYWKILIYSVCACCFLVSPNSSNSMNIFLQVENDQWTIKNELRILFYQRRILPNYLIIYHS